MAECKKKSVIKEPFGNYATYECNEDVFNGSDYCILHTEYPEFGTEEYKEINKLKMDKIREKMDKNDFTYMGAILDQIGFRDMDISNLNLLQCKLGSVHLRNVNIVGREVLDGAFKNFQAEMHFNGSKIDDVYFENVNVGNGVFFDDVEANQLIFNDVDFGWGASFNDIEIKKYIQFMNVNVGGNVNFNNSKFLCDNVNFEFSEIKGVIYLENAGFKRPMDQEEVFRIAKNIWESKGDRTEADKCFYKEMEAKRKQKHFYIRYPEWIFQKLFGYGIYPLRLFGTFFAFFLIFSLIYWYMTGIYNENSFNIVNLINGMRFSFLTLIIPAYGIVSPNAVNYGIFIIIESIVGAFMWPLFIATFARKYMR